MAADQADRQNWQHFDQKTKAEIDRISERDRERRKRVGEIFGEGCILEAKDYAAAALVFQHGDRPDHFWQTAMWVKRTVEMGETKYQRLMTLAIDRYLVETGRKQLFASQGNQPPGSRCTYLQQVEPSFPAELRKKLGGQSIEEAFNWIRELNAGTAECPALECEDELQPTPQGTIPGIW